MVSTVDNYECLEGHSSRRQASYDFERSHRGCWRRAREVGCIVKARTVGALIVEDEKGEDAKILSVPVNDARFDGYQDISDVHPHRLREIQEFFETYKRVEPRKWAKFKCWKTASEACVIVTGAMEKYGKMTELCKK